MVKPFPKYLLPVMFCLGMAPSGFAQPSSGPGGELLPPDEAFKLKVAFKGPQTLVADFVSAKNYYLYKNKVRFAVKAPGGVRIKEIRLPTGETKNDQFFGTMEIYRKPVQAEIALDRNSTTARKFTLLATYQGCSEKVGVCYPPIEKSVDLVLP
jgi:thiol:disulfide interchange protein DsbD